MKNTLKSLMASALLIAPMFTTAAGVPATEPKDSIVRPGHDLEWSQPEDTEYPYAVQQRAYQEWMRDTYKTWKSSLTEPMDPATFAKENREVRQALTAYHRYAVRTGNWSKYPSLENLGESMQPARSAVNMYDRSTYSRPSRRAIVRDAIRSNSVKVK